MTTLKIWHFYNHDDATVTEVQVAEPLKWISDVVTVGGFWAEGKFIPWHRVNQIEYA